MKRAWFFLILAILLPACATRQRSEKTPNRPHHIVPHPDDPPQEDRNPLAIAYVEGIATPDNFDNQLCWDIKDGDIPELTMGRERKALPNQGLVTHVIEYALPNLAYPFNPSIVELDDGYLMAVRFDCTELTKKGFQSYTLLAELDKNLAPRGKLQLLHRPSVVDPSVASHTAEDMRLFRHKGAIYGLVNDNQDGTDTTWVTRRQVRYKLENVNGLWKVVHVTRYERPAGSPLQGPEKNWVPLTGRPNVDNLDFGYLLWPFASVVEASKKTSSKGLQQTGYKAECFTYPPWDRERYGALRGGTPAIWLGDQGKYLSVFHAVAERKKGKAYSMGAYLTPPDSLCVTDISPLPIGYSGMYDEKKGFWVNLAGPASEVVFPTGLVAAHYAGRESFLVSAGVNDSTVKIFVLDRSKLINSLVSTDRFMANKLLKNAKEVLSASEKATVEAFKKKHRVSVSLTTSPTRLHNLGLVLDMISLDESVPKIYLTLPKLYGAKKESYTIPDWLNTQRYPKLTILRPDVDVGPLSKMLYAIREARKTTNDPDAVVISVDDDTGYTSDTYAQIIKELALNPNTVVSGSTQPVAFWGIDDNEAQHWHNASQSLVVEGFGAIGYRVGLVDDVLMEKFALGNRACFVSDDFVISYVLDRSQVERRRIQNEFAGIEHNFQFTWGFGPDALHRGKDIEELAGSHVNNEKYRLCNTYIRSTLKEAKKAS